METAKRQAAKLGSISSGTRRACDLLEAFRDELMLLDPATAEKLADNYPMFLGADRTWEKLCDEYPDDAEAYLEALSDALGELAPDMAYFGAHPGDGADFGYWVCDDTIRDAEHEGELVRVSDTPSYILHVSDHGNETLYRVKLEEVWGVV